LISSIGSLQAIGSYQGIILALGLGLLVGIERGWSRRMEPDGGRVAGIRTFGLLGLAGGIAGQANAVASGVSLVIAGACAAIMVAGYVRSSQSRKDVSATTAIVGIITLATGVMAASDHEGLACIVAAVTTLVLASRTQLHAWLDTLTEAEVQALARFALIALAILPVLPDEAMGPMLAWNPRRIWSIVVLVCGFSFAGHIAVRRFGASRGIVLSAVAGAMVSSTAVTASLAKRLREEGAAVNALVAGIVAATAVSYVRLLLLTAVLLPSAFAHVCLFIAPTALISTGWSAGLLWRNRAAAPQSSAAAPPGNPFELMPAVVLAALIAALSLAARWMQEVSGPSGLSAVLVLGGMADADSPVITLSGLPPGFVTPQVAGLIVSAAAMLNTAVKVGLVLGLGGVRSGWRAAAPLCVCIANACLLGVLSWVARI
jgi:uncharacterized membrane protein (DUF4010 family)